MLTTNGNTDPYVNKTIYVTLKDVDVYKKMKYTSVHRLMFKTETHVGVELEFIDIDSNWHIMCPYEHEFKYAEETNDKKFLSFWGKYRKWQKRKIYTIEEFNELFEPLK